MTDRVYHMDDCVVSMPTGFVDRSINVLEWSTPTGNPIVVAIQRDKLERLSLEEFVTRETKDYASKFFGWKLDRDDATELAGGVACRRIAFRWKRDNDVIYNHQAFVLGEGRVILFTASGKARDRDDIDRLLDELLDSMKFRED